MQESGDCIHGLGVSTKSVRPIKDNKCNYTVHSTELDETMLNLHLLR